MKYQFERLRPEYKRLWAQAKVVKVAAANRQARRIIANKERYVAVEHSTGVPWFVVGCMHMRESGGNFDTWLHNGDPMRRSGVPCHTRHVPAGRPPNPNISWEAGARDALVNCEHLDAITQWSPEHVAFALEKFNGFGYRHPDRNIPSPYLWGGTSVQRPGKFVRDGVYDANTVDPQIGGMAVLRALMDLDDTVSFLTPSHRKPPPPIEEDEDEDGDTDGRREPSARDTETNVKPLSQSKTLLGAIVSFIVSGFASIQAFFEKLDNPYTLAGFAMLLAIAGAALWLTVKGRLDVQAVIKHLSDDDTV